MLFGGGVAVRDGGVGGGCLAGREVLSMTEQEVTS